MENVSTLSTPALIGRIAGFAAQQLPSDVNEAAEEIAVEVEKGIVDPPEAGEAIAAAGELIKRAVPNPHVHEMVDSLVDLSIHEEGETWTEDLQEAFSAFNNGLKAWREARKQERKGD